MKKLLLTLSLIAFTALAQAQCLPSEIFETCDSTHCAEPTWIGQGVIIDGTNLWVNWNVIWNWTGGSCTQGITAIVNGVEYFANNAGYVWTGSVSGALIPNYVVTPGSTVCVKMRSYCVNPYWCDPNNFRESTEICVTAPALSTQPCKVGNKYVLELNGTTVLVNKIRCQRLVNQGWVSTCNCQ